jgi:hypothetical protein
MIAADKNQLKASIQQGTLRIQHKLIQLYQLNLDSIAVNGALMAIYSFKGFTTADYPPSHRAHYMQYVYHPIDVISLICALFCVSQATIATVFGPTVALTGTDPDSMKKAVKHMRAQQQFCYKIGVVSITCLYTAIGLLSWVKLPDYVAPIVCILLVFVYCVMIYEGKRTFDLFRIVPNEELGPSAEYKARGTEGTIADRNAVPEAELGALIATKARGVLFWQKPIHEGGKFRECCCVLDKGEFFFYKPDLALKDTYPKNALNRKPINFFDYTVTTDARRFQHHFNVLGQSALTMSDRMRSPYNLREAEEKFKLALMPKYSSELSPLPDIVLMATDEEAFERWLETFAKISGAYEELCRRGGGRDASIGAYQVESVLEAAATTRTELQI